MMDFSRLYKTLASLAVGSLIATLLLNQIYLTDFPTTVPQAKAATPTTLPTPTPTPAAASNVYFVEPFDFYYPDEGVANFVNINTSVSIKASLGEYESGTFVYRPDSKKNSIELFANDLIGPQGSVLKKNNIKVGVVTIMNRDRSLDYMQQSYLRGLNPEVKTHLPYFPMAIVPDEQEFFNNTANAVGHITLKQIDHAKTTGQANLAKQFWITVHIPDNFAPPQFRSLYKGALRLVVDGVTTLVPLEVETLNFKLDELWSKQKHIGVFQSIDQVEPAFKDAVMEDLKAHGANAMMHRGSNPADYAYFKSYDMKFAIPIDYLWLTSDQIKQIEATGLQTVFYGYDEPNYMAKKIKLQIDFTRSIHSRGGKGGTSGSLQALQEIDPRAHQDWWNLEFATSWNTTQPIFSHFDDVRADPTKKIATLESVYPMFLLELYPLDARLLTGFWLYNSKLDGEMSWAYAENIKNVNPYTNTGWNGVAFPAQFKNPDGVTNHYEMLSSYVWEAYREGIDDFRYALTAKRLVDSEGTIDQKTRFDSALASYMQIFECLPKCSRIDTRNPNGKVRETRYKLIDIISEILQSRQRNSISR